MGLQAYTTDSDLHSKALLTGDFMASHMPVGCTMLATSSIKQSVELYTLHLQSSAQSYISGSLFHNILLTQHEQIRCCIMYILHYYQGPWFSERILPNSASSSPRENRPNSMVHSGLSFMSKLFRFQGCIVLSYCQLNKNNNLVFFWCWMNSVSDTIIYLCRN